MARRSIGATKNKHARFQVIPRGLADELREWMLRTEGQRLFPDPRGGALSNIVLNKWHRALSNAAGVRVITSRGARHSAGSSYAVMGVGQKMIAKLLGHADTGATERYTHLQAEQTAPLVAARWAALKRPSTNLEQCAGAVHRTDRRRAPPPASCSSRTILPSKRCAPAHWVSSSANGCTEGGVPRSKRSTDGVEPSSSHVWIAANNPDRHAHRARLSRGSSFPAAGTALPSPVNTSLSGTISTNCLVEAEMSTRHSPYVLCDRRICR
jgi:hypothetical protein